MILMLKLLLIALLKLIFNSIRISTANVVAVGVKSDPFVKSLFGSVSRRDRENRVLFSSIAKKLDFVVSKQLFGNNRLRSWSIKNSAVPYSNRTVL